MRNNALIIFLLIVSFVPFINHAQEVGTISYIDSINTIWSGKSFWFNNRILPSRYSNVDEPPTYHYNVIENFTKFEYEILYCGGSDNAPAPSCYAWPNKSCVNYSESRIGGSSWNFFRAKLVDIKYLPIILDKEYSNFQRKKAISKYGSVLPYIRLVPDSITLYGSGNNYEKKFHGYEIVDTIFIPYSIEKLKYFISEQQLADFANAFKKQEQIAWDQHMAKYGNRNRALTKLYGKEIGDIISRGEVRFGFTKEMCNLSYDGEPYKPSYNVKTPLGLADCRNFYTKGIKLYFIDNLLIGIEWKDGRIKFK